MVFQNVSGGLRATLLFVLLASSSFAKANEAPTAPTNLNAISVSSTEIRLSWDPSTDDRRVKNYQLKRDALHIATTGKTRYNDAGLEPGTVYVYELVASDGSLLSPLASFSVSTLAQDPVDDTSTKPGKGKGKQNPPAEEPPVEEPPVDEPPVDEPPVDEPPVDEPPVDEPPSAGVPSGWQLVFNDDFEGSGDLDISSPARNWRFETMNDGLHRAGNTGIDANGDMIESWASVNGKRWSAWYNGFHGANAYRENGELIMGGYDSGETDPTRPIDYIDDGVLTQYGNSKLYSSWIDTFSRKWVGPGNEHVMDPESPGKIFKYGYIEARVNFSEMVTPGFRLSIWLMPASNDAEGQDLIVSSAYDGDGNNGVEIDLFEYEWINTDYENHIQLAILGGSAGSTATSFDTTSLGINLHEGYHTVGLLWEADKIVWTLDGHTVKEVYDIDLIPDVYSYLIVSREMNSGVKNPDIDNIEASDILEEWPYRPRDPGLYAKNIWEFRERINTDRAVIDYIKVWQP